MADQAQNLVEASSNLITKPVTDVKNAISQGVSTVKEWAASQTEPAAVPTRIPGVTAPPAQPATPVPVLTPTAQPQQNPYNPSVPEMVIEKNTPPSTDYGANAEYQAKVDRTNTIINNINYLRSLPSDQRAIKLRSLGLTEDKVNELATQVGMDEGQKPTPIPPPENQPKAGDYSYTKDAIKTVAVNTLKWGLIFADPEVAAAREVGMVLMAQLAKNYFYYKFAGATGDLTEHLVKSTFPDAGPWTAYLSNVVGSIGGGVGAASGIAGWQKFATEAVKDSPEIEASLAHAHDMLAEPAGLKEPIELKPEQEVKAPVELKPEQEVGKGYQKPVISEDQAALREKFNASKAVIQQAPRKLKSAVELAKDVKETAKEELPDKVKEETEGRVEDKELEKLKGEAEVPAEKESTRSLIIARQGALAEKLGLEQNEQAVNEIIERDTSKLPTPEIIAKAESAAKMSLRNVSKLSDAMVRADAKGDHIVSADAKDLFTHEAAKLNHLDQVINVEGARADVAAETAKAAAQAKELMQIVAAQTGKGKQAKVKTIMGWARYRDPYQIAIDARLMNPPLWLGKAITDSIWLPYNAFIKGLARAFTTHPEDAIHSWVGMSEGTADSIKDIFKYGFRSLRTGKKEVEEAFGMLGDGTKNNSNTWGQEYNDNAALANDYLTSLFNGSTIQKVSAASQFGTSFGSRVILAEDQIAKGFAQRIFEKGIALDRAYEEANAKGLMFGDRWRYASAAADKYVDEMPEWLANAVRAEAYRHTFTDQNSMATVFNQMSNLAKVNVFGQEMHLGRLAFLFNNTPINMFKQAMMNTPVGLTAALNPLGNSWIQQSMSQGREELTRMAVGSMIGWMIWREVSKANLTGDGPLNSSQNRQWRELGNSPRTIQVGGLKVDYSHWGPIATLLAMTANFAENYSAVPEGKRGNYMAVMFDTLKSTVAHAPLMYTLGNVMDAMGERGGEAKLEKFGHNIGKEFVPSVWNQISNILDPAVRKANTEMQRIAMDTGVGRADVPLKRDIWGYPQYVPSSYTRDEVPPTRTEAILHGMLGISMMPKLDEDEAEIMRVHASFQEIPDYFIGKAPSSSIYGDPDSPTVGVPYHPTDEVENAKLKDELEQLVGHQIKIDDKNMKETVHERIQDPEYHKMPDAGKKLELERIHTGFLWAGRSVLLDRHPDLGARVEQRGDEKRKALYGEEPDTTTYKLGLP